MAVKKFKPTTPSLRYQDGLGFLRALEEEAGEGADKSEEVDGWTKQSRARNRLVPRRRSQAPLSVSSTFTGRSTESRRRSRRSSTIRTAAPASRCCTMRTARSVTSSRRSAWRWATRLMSGPDVEIREGNAMPLRSVPPGTSDPQHRADPRQGRSGRARGRERVSDHGQGRALRAGEAPVGRGSEVRSRLLLHPRQGRQRRPRERRSSARPAGTAGWAGGRVPAASP